LQHYQIQANARLVTAVPRTNDRRTYKTTTLFAAKGGGLEDASLVEKYMIDGDMTSGKTPCDLHKINWRKIHLKPPTHWQRPKGSSKSNQRSPRPIPSREHCAGRSWCEVMLALQWRGTVRFWVEPLKHLNGGYWSVLSLMNHWKDK
jgi:hypothetical protein